MRNFQNTYGTPKRSFISTFPICLTIPLRTKEMFISSSTASGLEFWSLHHTSIYENFEPIVLKINFLGMKYLILDLMILWKEMYTRLLNHEDNCC